jgi:ribosomal protein S18 acetylase RimI-like enzyme
MDRDEAKVERDNKIIVENKNLKSFYVRLRKNLPKEIPPLNEIKKEIQNKNFHIYYLSTNNNKIITGALWYEKSRKRAHIYFMFTSKKFRKKGYAKLMLEYIISAAKKRHFDLITAFINPNNHIALILFLNNGFKIFGYLFDKGLLMAERKL